MTPARENSLGEIRMDEPQVIDPHHHLWDLERFAYPWLTTRPLPPSVAGDVAPIAHSYGLADYLAEAAGHNLVKSVHVDAGFDPTQPVEETRWLQSVADRHGFPHGIVARAELHKPDVEAVLAGHAAFANTRGIRHIVNWHPDPAKTYVTRPDLLTDPAWLAGFALLKRYGLSFDLQLYPSQMADAARLAARHPDTLIILNHAGMPVDRDAEALVLWRRGMRGLAAAPNLLVKISGLGMVDWCWSEASIRPFVLETIEIFGIDRAMFASNFPVDKLYSSFGMLYRAFKNIVADFQPAEKRKLFHDNAAAAYRL
jgi:predicted TIM-barrel fold metal-dependent hydrolase